MKKTNNKGFSLVELIVVIAIMAVLMVVVAPQLLRYVDKARIQRDNSAIAEIANAAKIAMAEQNVYDYVSGQTGSQVTISIANGSVTFGSGTDLLGTELGKTIAPTVTLTSNKYQTSTVTLKVAIVSDNVEVSATGMYKTDGTAETGPVKF